MVRAFFFALGMFMCLVGGELFMVDRAILNLRDDPQSSTGFRWAMARPGVGQPKEFNPPDWAAWALTSAGAVTLLYAIALPRARAAQRG